MQRKETRIPDIHFIIKLGFGASSDTMRFLHRNNYVRDNEHRTQLQNLKQANKSSNNDRFKVAFFGCKSQLRSVLYVRKKDFEDQMLPMTKSLFSRCV